MIGTPITDVDRSIDGTAATLTVLTWLGIMSCAPDPLVAVPILQFRLVRGDNHLALCVVEQIPIPLSRLLYCKQLRFRGGEVPRQFRRATELPSEPAIIQVLRPDHRPYFTRSRMKQLTDISKHQCHLPHHHE